MTITDDSRKRFEELYQTVLDASLYAKDMQKGVERNYKEDGSVLTRCDLEISKMITDTVSRLFPEADIISEEEVTATGGNAPMTFILDPIDGTDVFSQGLASFAVSLGILDEDRMPVGAMIAAPRFGIAEEAMNVHLLPGEDLFLNGRKVGQKKESGPGLRQVAFTSHDIGGFDLTRFKGKTRTFGSTIIHLLLPALLEEFDGTVSQPCYVWDLAASHAVLLKQGMDICNEDGTRLEYTDEFLYGRKKCPMCTYAGRRDKIQEMLEVMGRRR